MISKAHAHEYAEPIKRAEKQEVERFNMSESPDTTPVAVIDVEGNCVTMTHSLGMPFGVITNGLGFIYNGCMGVVQALLNILDFDMPIVEAINAPRFSATSNLIDITNRIPEYEIEPLRAQGYRFVRSPNTFDIGRAHGITCRNSKLQGGADPGSDGVALGVTAAEDN